MPLPSDVLPSDETCPPGLRSAVETYTDQGGLLGAFTYALVDLETVDEALAATMAEIPTNLFVTSSLHDDAIDEAEAWDDRKRRLNEHVTAGDLVFTNVLEAAHAVPADVDLAPVLAVTRAIGTGQLREERLEPSSATPADAIDRIEQRGAVWGDLAVALVRAVGGYSRVQRDALRRVATNAMFVLTVADDVEDLPEDVDNGVASLPVALYDGDLAASESTAAVDAFLDSDAPDRLGALVADRRARLEAAAYEFGDTIYVPNERLLAAVHRALTWYCESVCSIPVERTVPRAHQRDLRARLEADGTAKRRVLESVVSASPFDARVDRDALEEQVAPLPAEPLADVVVMLTHVQAVIDGIMNTSLADALATLERRGASQS